ncbi:MAG: hypothetical protein NTW49_07640 [Bacteroidia bacterium]|nr:hypothetical protein [Bacteroidia bacterium]
MKNIYFQLLFVLSMIGLSFVAGATVITVSNSVVSAAQYSNLQTALDNCNVNDTIYVLGSVTSYGTIHIKKRITLFGAGYDPYTTQLSLQTKIGTVYIDTLTFPISGMKICGFQIEGMINNSNTAVKSVTIERNRINSSGPAVNVGGNNWVIRNNILGNWVSSINVNYYSNILILNNFIYYGAVVNSSSSSVLISNNIFYNFTSFSNVSNAIFTNNIFLGAVVSGCSLCSFSSNITYNSGSLPDGNNSGAGNFNNMNPLFVSANIPMSGVDWLSIKNYDWHLQSSSPGHNTGTDGTDIGIFGGSYQFHDFTGTPPIPLITIMNVINSNVPQNGTLNVNFKAIKAY